MATVSSQLVTFADTPMAVPPAAVMSSTTDAIASGSRPFTATFAPLAAKATQVAAPMPREPPVTRTTRPSRSGKRGAIALGERLVVERVLGEHDRPVLRHEQVLL